MTPGSEQIAWARARASEARDACPAYGVPWQVPVAQGVVETGWGRSYRHHNWLGIKGPPIALVSHRAETPEVVRGVRMRVPRWFRSYRSDKACLHAYCRMVSRGRYAGARFYVDRPAWWLAYVWASGYASGEYYVEAAVQTLATLAAATGDDAFGGCVDVELRGVLDVVRVGRRGLTWRRAGPHLALRDQAFGGLGGTA
ncbi:MAG: glucosaminidase domain-containing protein [Pseudomonadota bacterium]